MAIFPSKMNLLDEKFKEFLKIQTFKGQQVASLTQLINLKTEEFQEFIQTELEFPTGVKLPWEVKTAVIETFSSIFRD